MFCDYEDVWVSPSTHLCSIKCIILEGSSQLWALLHVLSALSSLWEPAALELQGLIQRRASEVTPLFFTVQATLRPRHGYWFTQSAAPGPRPPDSKSQTAYFLSLAWKKEEIISFRGKKNKNEKQKKTKHLYFHKGFNTELDIFQPFC